VGVELITNAAAFPNEKLQTGAVAPAQQTAVGILIFSWLMERRKALR